MLNRKMYKPELIIDNYTIKLSNSIQLTGMCTREIICKQNGLNPKSIHDSNLISHITYMSIKYN